MASIYLSIYLSPLNHQFAIIIIPPYGPLLHIICVAESRPRAR